MPWRRPSSTTLPANHGNSRRLPRNRSLPIEVMWWSGIERIIARPFSTASGLRATPSARPTAAVSSMLASTSAHKSGSARYLPSGPRARPPVELAERHLLIRAGLPHDARRDDRAGDKGGAAHHRVMPEDWDQP